jgi:monovalent cation/hydrogen antiporter
MEATVTILILTLLVIAAASVLAPRLRVAAPLILMVAGIAASFAPAVPRMTIDPELILAGVLPPLLYASAASIPALNFRREFGAISGLSVLLVVMTSLVLGFLFAWLVPDLGLVWGVALGAIISPTDAVATSLIKGGGAPGRVVVILEGESLINDATALVVLRTAIIAVTAGFSVWGALGAFAYSVAVAVAIGGLVGWLSVTLRGRMREPAVNTILSLATPFVAALPAELAHSSGLVAAVVAGLVTGVKAPRSLPPGHRLSDNQTWDTLGLILEGFVFLTMGLQLSGILEAVSAQPDGLKVALGIAAIALIVTVLIRAAYVTPLLWGLHRSRLRGRSMQPRVEEMQRALDAGQVPIDIGRRGRGRRRGRPPSERFMDRFATRVRRALADIEYLERQPLGVREGAIVVWAGMRGAVTVAAAQLLPATTPHRSLLILVSFAVAAQSLLIQGGTIGLLVGRLFAGEKDEAEAQASAADRRRIQALLAEAATRANVPAAERDLTNRIAVIKSQRLALLDARDDGLIDAEALTAALRNLDAEQLTLELRA